MCLLVLLCTLNVTLTFDVIFRYLCKHMFNVRFVFTFTVNILHTRQEYQSVARVCLYLNTLRELPGLPALPGLPELPALVGLPILPGLPVLQEHPALPELPNHEPIDCRGVYRQWIMDYQSFTTYRIGKERYLSDHWNKNMACNAIKWLITA